MRTLHVILFVGVSLVAMSGTLEAQVFVKYTDNPDDEASALGGQHLGEHPEQVLRTRAPDGTADLYPQNLVDFEFMDGEVDALADQKDEFFVDLLNNAADLLISVSGEDARKCVSRENPGGSRRVLWDHNDFSNWEHFFDPNLTDVDALEVHVEGGPIYPIFFSLEGDPFLGDQGVFASVFHYSSDGTVTYYVTRSEIEAQIIGHLGWTEDGNCEHIDVDALMVLDKDVLGVWDTNDTIIFSIRECGNWDGGEIVVMPASSPSTFLHHGGHDWNTGFNVQRKFGVSTEEVDAIEAYEPSDDDDGSQQTSSRWDTDAPMYIPDPGGSTTVSFTLNLSDPVPEIVVEFGPDLGGGEAGVTAISGTLTMQGTRRSDGGEDHIVDLNLVDSNLVGGSVTVPILGDTGINTQVYTELVGTLDLNTGQVDLIGSATISNDLFPPSNPVVLNQTMQSGNLDTLQGRLDIWTTATESLPVAIPTVSEWGLVVMTLLVLTAGTMVFRRRTVLWS